MGNVVEKMRDKVPNCLFGFQVLLAAMVAVAADQFSLAVQTIFLLTFVKMRHSS